MKTIVRRITEKALAQFITEKGLPTETLAQCVVDVDIPKNTTFGDFSVNCAFKLSRSCRKPPLAIAEEFVIVVRRVVSEDAEISPLIDSVSVAKPGFVNFLFSPAINARVLSTIHEQSEQYGKNSYGEGDRVVIEFVSANPTGPLTIAHGRQACLGDTLAAIMKTCGFAVTKEFYLNDGGNQIKMLGQSVFSRYQTVCGVDSTFPEDGYQGDYVIDIAQKIYGEKGDVYKNADTSDAEVLSFFSQYAADLILGEIKEDLALTGVSFDTYYHESTLYESKVAQVLAELKEREFTYEKDGALWFRSSDLGDAKDRVLIKSDGTYTYLVPDIAYHKDKFERGYATLINLLGPDHHGYIARLKASMKALGFSDEALHVIIVQLTTLYKNGEPFKMSTRKGTFITFRELIDEVGADAARLFFLMKLMDSQLSFDLELAKEKSQENPVYYLHYAYARISSIIRLSEKEITDSVDTALLVAEEERVLVKLLAEYPYLLITAAEQREPYRLVDYARDLAAAFHKFYNVCRVISDDSALTEARLFLVHCVRRVLGNALTLLGVSSPERM